MEDLESARGLGFVETTERVAGVDDHEVARSDTVHELEADGLLEPAQGDDCRTVGMNGNDLSGKR
jgi:hypothetical protein